jgi:hypothetical protein
LAYLKWIPGEHALGGPLSQVVRLKFSAGGKTLAGRRDDLDMHGFHVRLPVGVRRVQADLDFACVMGGEGFRSDVCSSHNQRVVWWEVVLYSPEVLSDQNPVQARIRFPAGWTHGSALPIESEQSGNWIQFKTVSLKTRVDSPLRTGAPSYHDGIQYPHLERYCSTPDLLRQIATPRGRHEDAH